MRKLMVVALVAGLATGCSLLPTLNVGAGVSAVMPEDPSLENTYMVDGFAKIEVSSLQVEASIGYKQYTYTEVDGATENTVDQVPFAATARFIIPGGLVRIMFGGGLMWNINGASDIQSIEVDNALAYRLLVGADLALVSSLKLGLEVSYDLSTDVDVFGSDNELDADGLMARVTFGYHF